MPLTAEEKQRYEEIKAEIPKEEFEAQFKQYCAAKDLAIDNPNSRYHKRNLLLTRIAFEERVDLDTAGSKYIFRRGLEQEYEERQPQRDAELYADFKKTVGTQAMGEFQQAYGESKAEKNKFLTKNGDNNTTRQSEEYREWNDVSRNAFTTAVAKYGESLTGKQKRAILDAAYAEYKAEHPNCENGAPRAAHELSESEKRDYAKIKQAGGQAFQEALEYYGRKGRTEPGRKEALAMAQGSVDVDMDPKQLEKLLKKGMETDYREAQAKGTTLGVPTAKLPTVKASAVADAPAVEAEAAQAKPRARLREMAGSAVNSVKETYLQWRTDVNQQKYDQELQNPGERRWSTAAKNAVGWLATRYSEAARDRHDAKVIERSDRDLADAKARLGERETQLGNVQLEENYKRERQQLRGEFDEARSTVSGNTARERAMARQELSTQKKQAKEALDAQYGRDTKSHLPLSADELERQRSQGSKGYKPLNEEERSVRHPDPQVSKLGANKAMDRSLDVATSYAQTKAMMATSPASVKFTQTGKLDYTQSGTLVFDSPDYPADQTKSAKYAGMGQKEYEAARKAHQVAVTYDKGKVIQIDAGKDANFVLLTSNQVITKKGNEITAKFGQDSDIPAIVVGGTTKEATHLSEAQVKAEAMQRSLMEKGGTSTGMRQTNTTGQRVETPTHSKA